MAISTKKYLQAISLGGGTNISELEDATPEADQEILWGRPGGYPEPLYLSLRGVKPQVRFTTVQLTDFFTVINAGVPPYIADQSAGNTDLYYQDAPNKASRSSSSGTVHQRFRMANACLYWTRLSAVHQQDAKVEAVLKPVWDGTNVPLVAAGSVALTVTPADGQRFTMGQVELNGTALAGVQQWSVDSGIKIDQDGSEGEIYDSFVGLEQTQPMLTITGRTIEWWNTYGLGLAAATVTFYLIKKAPTGNLAAGTANHIKITATLGLILPQDTKGLKSSTTLRVPIAAQDATHNSLTINTASAIT